MQAEVTQSAAAACETKSRLIVSVWLGNLDFCRETTERE